MIKSIMVYMSIVNALFILLLKTEILSLPPPHKTLSIMNNSSLSHFSTFLILTTLLILIPITSCSLILRFFKKYIFNHSKSIVKSYELITRLLYMSYMGSLFLFMLDFLMKLAFKENSYLTTRISSLMEHDHNSHLFVFSLLNTSISQAMSFILSFMIIEMIIAYKQYNSQYGFLHFFKRNLTCVVFVFGVLTLYLAIFLWFEYNFFMFSNRKYDLGENLLEKFHYGLFLNLISMYIYGILMMFA